MTARLVPVACCPSCGTVLDGGPVLYHCPACRRGVYAADLDTSIHDHGTERRAAA
jgi:hypothetical protein